MLGHVAHISQIMMLSGGVQLPFKDPFYTSKTTTWQSRYKYSRFGIFNLVQSLQQNQTTKIVPELIEAIQNSFNDLYPKSCQMFIWLHNMLLVKGFKSIEETVISCIM